MRIDEAPIAGPCDEDLDRMPLDGSGCARFCERCSTPVHDLSAMGPERARALLARTSESICIAYVADHRGELVFESARGRVENFVPLGRVLQAAALVALMSGCTPHSEAVPLQILEDAAPLEQAPIAPVIPTAKRAWSPPPVEPAVPSVDEPCEPEPSRTLVKGKRKHAGVYRPPPEF